jgi:hypothetical protein
MPLSEILGFPSVTTEPPLVADTALIAVAAAVVGAVGARRVLKYNSLPYATA